MLLGLKPYDLLIFFRHHFFFCLENYLSEITEGFRSTLKLSSFVAE